MVLIMLFLNAWSWQMREFVKQIHFVGVGGAGMSGIASVLLDQGYIVSGSDIVESDAILSLKSRGADIWLQHNADNIRGADVVVMSNAISNENPEILYAKNAGIPVVPRAQMLGELMRFRNGIAVGGTHGKTTTTSLIASIFAEAGLDPTFLIGGLIKNFAGNARLGNGSWLIAEADESDASFLYLQPHISVITSIDADHLSAYDDNFDKLVQTFLSFIHNLPFYGLAVLCSDDPIIRKLRKDICRAVVTYGIKTDSDYRADNIRQEGTRMYFDVSLKNTTKVEIDLAIPGLHNVSNALGAIAVADRVGIPSSAICDGLKKFPGISRRFEILGQIPLEKGSAIVVDDYAHHPRELEVTIAAAEQCWPNRRKVIIFQPHRFSRTEDLLDDFSALLSSMECLLVTEVYSAGEKAVSKADGRALCRSIRARGGCDPLFVPSLINLEDVLMPLVRDEDIILALGAGDIGRWVRDFVANVQISFGSGILET